MSYPPERRCFSNAGQIYYGDVIDGADGEIVRHGQGQQINKGVTKDGEAVRLATYEGSWKNGRITGNGVYRWSDGSVYEGSFLDGRLHGVGRLSWPEGSVYDGMWVQGEMTGQGKFENAFDGITTQGVFCRNSVQQHDGTWVDVHRLRQEHHATWLQIGALGPGVEAHMPLMRCTSESLSSTMSDVLRQNLVPLILADRSCPEAPAQAEGAASSSSPGPLWCLEQGQRGCTPQSTVYIAYAALEKKRKRDFQQVFRKAIREALLEYRPFVLVFNGSDCANPQDGEPLPAAWRLPEFFDPFCLPTHLFDLQHFHSSGGEENFLPSEDKRKASLRGAATASGPGLGEVVDQADSADAGEESGSPAVAPPIVPVLRFAMVSLGRIEANLDDNSVRKHVGRQFASHVPLHRMAIVIVSGPPEK
jgi:hypothetical protein